MSGSAAEINTPSAHRSAPLSGAFLSPSLHLGVSAVSHNEQSLEPGSKTTLRDQYFRKIFSCVGRILLIY
jgi:hypothetical protein